MVHKICALSFALSLFTSSAVAQNIKKPASSWRQEIEQNAKLIAGSVALGAIVGSVLTFCVMRGQLRSVASEVRAKPDVGVAGRVKTVAVGRKPQDAKSNAGAEGEGMACQASTASSASVSEPTKPVGTLLARFGGAAVGSGVLSRRGSQRMSESVRRLNDDTAEFCQTFSLEPKMKLLDKIIAHLRAMTTEQIREAAGYPSFWEKLIGDLEQGKHLFAALTAEQVAAATTHFMAPLPREQLAFDDDLFVEVVDVAPMVTRFRQLATALQAAVDLHEGHEEMLLAKIEAIMKAIGKMVANLEGEKARGRNFAQTLDVIDAAAAVHQEGGTFERGIVGVLAQLTTVAKRTLAAPEQEVLKSRIRAIQQQLKFGA